MSKKEVHVLLSLNLEQSAFYDRNIIVCNKRSVILVREINISFICGQTIPLIRLI